MSGLLRISSIALASVIGWRTIKVRLVEKLDCNRQDILLLIMLATTRVSRVHRGTMKAISSMKKLDRDR